MKRYLAFIALMLGTAILIMFSGIVFPTAVAIPVFILAVVSDSTTTYLCLRANGKEGNPMVAFLFRKVGVPATFGIVAAIWTLFIVFRLLHQPENVQTAVSITFWLVPMNNLISLSKLKRKGVHSD